jgi:hypothetical protein
MDVDQWSRAVFPAVRKYRAQMFTSAGTATRSI